MKLSDEDWAQFDPRCIALFHAEDDRGVVTLGLSHLARALTFALRKRPPADEPATTKSFATLVEQILTDERAEKASVKRLLVPFIGPLVAISERFEHSLSATLSDEPTASELNRMNAAFADILRHGLGDDEGPSEVEPRKIFAAICHFISGMAVTLTKLDRGDE